MILTETDSTNAEALRRAAGLAAPTWIMAHRQTAARGRRGRPWAMPEGNFAASLVTRSVRDPSRAALLSFVAALALCDAIEAFTGRPDGLSLKWPNDLLLHGGKLAGILLESAGRGRRLDVLVIGIGVNLAAAPEPGALEPGAVRPVSLAGETGLRPSPDEVLTELAAAYATREELFLATGFAPIREAWLARAARLGETVTARTGHETRRGRFETVDACGAIVLHTPDGRRAIPAADVFF